MKWLARLIRHYKKQYVEYVTCKEDCHEMSYRQADRGFLKRRTFIILGTLLRLGYLGVVIWLTYTNYNSLKYSTKFVSLDKDSGECEEVPKTYVLPNIEADTNGVWEVSKDFDNSKAAYSFSLFNFQVTSDQYVTFIDDVESAIKNVGAAAEKENLAINLLYWAYWSKEIPVTDSLLSDQSYTIRFTGEPNTMLDLDQIKGTITSVTDICPPNIIRKEFDPANGELSAVFSMTEFQNNAACGNILKPASLGYDQYQSGDEFKLTLDVTSSLATLAANYMITTETSLTYISQYGDSISYNGKTYTVGKYYHTAFPNGQILYCVKPDDSQNPMDRRCVTRIGATFAVPFFQHYGIGADSTFEPIQCDCNTPNIGSSKQCNSFDFLVGAIMYDHDASAVGTPRQGKTWPARELAFIPILELFYGGLTPNQGQPLAAQDPKDVNEKIYHAAFFSIAQGEATGAAAAYYSNQANRNKYWNPFQTSFGTPFLLSFRLFSNFEKHAINTRSYHVDEGSCSDTFSSQEFKQLQRVDNAFGLLVEPYYSCTQFSSDAFINAAGVASGLVGLFLPLFVYLLMSTLMLPNVFAGTKYVELVDEGDDAIDESDNKVENVKVVDDKVVEETGDVAISKSDIEKTLRDAPLRYKPNSDNSRGVGGGVIAVVSAENELPPDASLDDLKYHLERIYRNAANDIEEIQRRIDSVKSRKA